LQLSGNRGGIIMRRILVIHSTSDQGVDDRIAAMAKKPELAECEFHHLTFIRPEDAEELSQLKPSEFLRLNESKIFQRIEAQIKAKSRRWSSSTQALYFPLRRKQSCPSSRC
jgi:hypothetical protein